MNAKQSTAPKTKKSSPKKSPKAKAPAPAAAEIQAEKPTPVSTVAPSAAPTSAVAKPEQQRPAKQPQPKRVTAIDAAAQVLADVKVPMTSKELIAAMTERKLWTSPAGQTPHATLYSAILREIGAKGSAARFVKCAERGKFAAKA